MELVIVEVDVELAVEVNVELVLGSVVGDWGELVVLGKFDEVLNEISMVLVVPGVVIIDVLGKVTEEKVMSECVEDGVAIDTNEIHGSSQAPKVS